MSGWGGEGRLHTHVRGGQPVLATARLSCHSCGWWVHTGTVVWIDGGAVG